MVFNFFFETLLVVVVSVHSLPIDNRSDTHNATDSNDVHVFHFHKLSKIHNLHNPCSPGRQPKDMSLEDEVSYTQLTASLGNRVGLSLLRELITKSSFLQGLATNVIRMNLIEECTELRLPSVANVPQLHELYDKKLMESIDWLYTSLTNQTAHTFFIWNNQQNYVQHNCSVHRPADVPLPEHNPRKHSKVLAQHYWTIAVNLRDLMCIFNQVSDAFNFDLKREEAANRVITHTIADTSICSRRAALDCQILKSSIILLENMSDFLRQQTVQLVSNMKNT